MNQSPGTLPPQQSDWSEWREALPHFAAASGLVVSAYDAQGHRQLGPCCTTRLADLLASSPLWDENGPGVAFERELMARSAKSGQVESAKFCNELLVYCAPLTLFSETTGFVLFGWNFSTYTSARACENLARVLRMPELRLWREARLHAPVSAERMQVYLELLRTLIAAGTRQAEAIARLNQLNKARELFLATVSHEMRTPLAAIALRIELMLRGDLKHPDSIRQHLNAMLGHVRQEAHLVEDLIDAAQTLTGKLSISPAMVSLNRILTAALSTVAPKAQAKQISLVSQVEVAGEVQLWGDERRLQQLFWNLLFNAVKFTPVGGQVSLAVKTTADAVEVTVSDNGQGIAPQDLPLLFDAFNKRSLNNEQGLGLGLFIVKHIVDLHRGTISAASEGIDRGAVFTVHLPLGPDGGDISQVSHNDGITRPPLLLN